MSDDPYDETNIREPKFRCRASIEPKHDDPSKLTLSLSVSDGPETWGDFDPAKGFIEEDSLGDGTLAHAVAKAANGMIEEAQRQESGRWIEDHEEVFVVRGCTGEGPDAKTWDVRAFLSESRADALAWYLNDLCTQNALSSPGDLSRYRVAMALKPLREDPAFAYDHATGTRYDVVRVPLDMIDPISGD